VLNAAAPVIVPPKKTDSKLELVDYSVNYSDSDRITIPEIDLKMRNVGDQVAFAKELRVETLGEATYEDCRRPEYSLMKASATYEMDILKEHSKAISHEIKPQEADRITVRVGRSEGGPTLTVYKVVLSVIYDEDNKKAISKPFFLKMTGPTTWAGMYTPGVDKESWDACVQRNLTNFRKIGYKIYKDMD
jgi:hypothetical protein